MSKNKKNNPYLEAYNKADKTLTQIMSDIKMLTTNPKDKMDKDTYTFKVNQLTTKWNNELGYLNNDGKPTRDLNFIVQDLEKTKNENSTALGSRYTLIPGTNFMSVVGSTGLGITAGGPTNFNRNSFAIQPKFSSESGRDYVINPHYIDSFNPKGEANLQIQKEKAAVDEYGRDYDNPNFGINPKRLNLSIQNGE